MFVPFVSPLLRLTNRRLGVRRNLGVSQRRMRLMVGRVKPRWQFSSSHFGVFNKKDNCQKFSFITATKDYGRVEDILSPLSFSLDVPYLTSVGRIVEVTEPTTNANNQQPKLNGFSRWKNSLVKRLGDRWSTSAKNMKLLGCRKNKKKSAPPLQTADQHKKGPARIQDQKPSACARLKTALRCRFVVINN